MELFGVVLFWAVFLIVVVFFMPYKKNDCPSPLTVVKTGAAPLHDDFLPSHIPDHMSQQAISMGELHMRVISLETEIKQLKQDING
jgi:hypothetical protein